MNQEMISEILRIVKKGNSAEIKKEGGKLVVVEIQRKVKIKAPANGQE